MIDYMKNELVGGNEIIIMNESFCGNCVGKNGVGEWIHDEQQIRRKRV